MKLIRISVLSLLIVSLCSVVFAEPPYDNKRGTIIYQSRDTGCVWDESYPVPKHIIYFDSCTEANPCTILGTNGYVLYDFKYCEFFEIVLGESVEFPDYSSDYFLMPIAPDGRKAVLIFSCDMCGTAWADAYFVRHDGVGGFELQSLEIVRNIDCVFADDKPWRVNKDGAVTLLGRDLRYDSEAQENPADTSEFFTYDIATIYYDATGDSLAVK